MKEAGSSAAQEKALWISKNIFCLAARSAKNVTRFCSPGLGAHLEIGGMAAREMHLQTHRMHKSVCVCVFQSEKSKAMVWNGFHLDRLSAFFSLS